MNLIAYEMCPDFKNDFTVTSYMCFLDLLIDEAEDVKDLRDASILYNGLRSDEEVARLFNKMNTDLVPSPMIYSGVKRKIHNHCKKMCIKHAGQAYHAYFRSPWTFLAFVGAITALLRGALQTYYAIHQPNIGAKSPNKTYFTSQYTHNKTHSKELNLYQINRTMIQTLKKKKPFCHLFSNITHSAKNSLQNHLVYYFQPLSLKMSSTEEGGRAVGGVSTDQTIIINNNNNDSVSIDIPCTDIALSSGELANLQSLDKALDGGQPTLRDKPLIRKVPSTLRRKEGFKKYFKPKVISIGPLHHDDPTLHESKELKLKLAANFFNNINVHKDSLYSNMKKEIDSLKKCYDPQELEKYSDDDEKLAWMFFVDGCAILQAVYLRYSHDCDRKSKLFIKNDLLTFVYSDLFLLENQLPFRVLELLTNSGDGKKFMSAIIRFIEDTVINPAEMKEPQPHQQDRFYSSKWWKLKNPVHLLNLLRVRLLLDKEKIRKTMEELSANSEKIRKTEEELSNSEKIRKTVEELSADAGSTNSKQTRARWRHSHTFRNVKELKKAWIWLKASETSCLTDISFKHIFFVGKLRLPPITVDDSTMNLIAYEMCPDFDNDYTVTSYMCFLDSLIDGAEDVRKLSDAGILYNGLGSDEEVAKLFNKMNTDLIPNLMIYGGVKRKIHNHCKNMWINHAARAYNTYFSIRWTFLAFVYYTIHQRK
ncbi:hypothetical protein CXB51_029555 [Gossypium anomalum]|uniref:Uncharacterized protein n=1 Tax=Gossypium anomalum TaxID=47600 RepID=A0A8J5YC42_9ROSI|nr:hypothetical protein CXB51_029555 [Gossypium anomalum]